MQSFRNRRSNEFTAGNIAGIMDAADNPAFAVFVSAGE
jgi:hypothetical protein